MKNESSIKRVNNICKQVLKLTEEDFHAIDNMAAEQVGYIHPLKNATVSRLNKLGQHNMRVSEALKNLRKTIESFKK